MSKPFGRTAEIIAGHKGEEMSSLNGVLKNWQQEVNDDYEDEPISPKWPSSGVPFCSQRECRQYDGKRCKLTGYPPDQICEPAVMSMAEMLEEKS